jgi:hypothetical protein
MSDIPLARARLAKITAQMRRLADEAEALQALLTRVPTGRPRAPATSAPIDAQKVDDIRRFAAAFPTMSQQKIAEVFEVNIGRVGGALRKKPWA